MQYSHNICQLSLASFQKIGFDIPFDHPLVKLADNIPWELLVDKISSRFAKCGRRSKSIRMMLGLELAKTFYDVSDEMIISMLQTDVAVMYFCGFTAPIGIDIPDSSSLTKFRNRLDKETLEEISKLSIQIVVRKLHPRKVTQVASDSSCLPANITYPTDTKLLTTAIGHLNDVVDELREKEFDIINRGKVKIRKFLNVFNRKRIKSENEIKRAKRKLIIQTKRIIRLIKKHAGELSDRSKQTVKKSLNILSQQVEMYKEKTKRIKERIVSFHEDKLRPIFRGKLQAVTEFGKKMSIMVVGQKVIIPTQTSYDNFSDTLIPLKDIEVYKNITGRYPKEYSADRGMHSPKNHRLLEKINCIDGIQYRGKIPKSANFPKNYKRLCNNRSCVEGKIGTLKTRYGMSKIRYKSGNTDIRFHLGILLHNFNWYVRN